MNPGLLLPERYVTLCLQVDQHIEDFVDAYFGPPSLREAARAEGPVEPARLRDEARSLLEGLPEAGLEDDRVEWLRGQLRGLECVTARLAGEEMSWSDEVERCFGVRPHHVDEGEFRASHKRLDDALPGSGDLKQRFNAWRDAATLSPDVRPRAIEAFRAEFRRRTAATIVDLPEGETVEFEPIAGEPWEAFNAYQGGYRSVVEVNVGFPISLPGAVDIVAHEAYPGHHTERASKERALFKTKDRFETCVTIVSAPEALMTEGIATNALDAVLGPTLYEALGPAFDQFGLHVDPAVASVLHTEEWNLFAAATNAARMLHEDGISRAEAVAYLGEWMLDSPKRVAKTVNFISDPGNRTYTTAYTDGRRLCRAFIERTPDGFRRLLTEQLTTTSLLG